MLGSTFSSKLISGFRIICLQESKSLDLFYEVFFLMLFCISINLPYGHAWYTFAMSGLVLLVGTWNC